MFVPSYCDKSGTSCYHLVTKLMTVTDLIATSCSNKTNTCKLYIRNKLLRACCHQLVVLNNLLHADDIGLVLEQLVTSLLASSTLLPDDNNYLFQTCQQLETSSANTSCLLTSCRAWNLEFSAPETMKVPLPEKSICISDRVKPIVEKIRTLRMIYIARGYTLIDEF